MIKVYLTRHGETENNFKSLTQGSKFDSKLTLKGVKQIEQKLKILKANKVKIDSIITTDSGRTKESLQIFNKELCVKKIIYVKNLKGIDWGDLSNKHYSEVQSHLINISKDRLYKLPGGESFQDIQTRSVASILDLESTHANQSLLIIGHGNVLKSIVMYFKKMPNETFLIQNMPNEYLSEMVINNGKMISYNVLTEDKNLICI